MTEESESVLGTEPPQESTRAPASVDSLTPRATMGTSHAGMSVIQTGPVVHPLDVFDLAQFVQVAANFGSSRFGYAVTPNVDHLVRYHEDASFRALYRDATFVLPDSRFCALLLRLLKGVRLPVGTASDLTAELLSSVVMPSDRIVVLGASTKVAERLAAMYELRNLRHYNPPVNFINHPEMVEQCLRFIEQASPFRFCFLGVGSPQQEVVAQRLHSRGAARGLAFCIGDSLNFIVGAPRRAHRLAYPTRRPRAKRRQ